jgi:SAM-dependent methyltransferase
MLDVLDEASGMLADRLEIPEEEINRKIARLRAAGNLEEFFSAAGIEYMAPGDASATNEAPGSTDLYFSYAVLEHVPVGVVEDMVKESRRILRPGGCFYAYIGLHDHYAGFEGGQQGQFPAISRMAGVFFDEQISFHKRSA